MRKRVACRRAASRSSSLAVAAGLVVSRAKSGEGPDGKGKKPEVTLEFTPAEVVKPVLTAMPERIEFSGALMAPRTAVVRAKANGTLLTLAVAEGSRVKTGQVLGTIDLSDLQSRAAERSAMVDSAKAKLIEAERSHRANEDLAKQKFISETALETSRATLDAMRAQLKSAQAQLASTSGRHPRGGAGRPSQRRDRQAQRRAGREGRAPSRS